MLPCRLLARKGLHPLTMRDASDYQSHQHNDWSAKDIPDHEISPQIRRFANLMVSDLDIWRAASLLIRKHGANVELEAAKRADLMLDRGDDGGRLVWTRIRRAIEALQAVPSGGLH
jgi:hypothetical protein